MSAVSKSLDEIPNIPIAEKGILIDAVPKNEDTQRRIVNVYTLVRVETGLIWRLVPMFITYDGTTKNITFDNASAGYIFRAHLSNVRVEELEDNHINIYFEHEYNAPIMSGLTASAKSHPTKSESSQFGLTASAKSHPTKSESSQFGSKYGTQSRKEELTTYKKLGLFNGKPHNGGTKYKKSMKNKRKTKKHKSRRYRKIK
jgi:hypothetical protein